MTAAGANVALPFFNDPQHWRDRAEEARVQAEQVIGEEPRRVMLQIAADYEKLARRAEERLAKQGEGEGIT